MMTEILLSIILFFSYASTISLIPVLIITGNYWYFIIAHIVASIILSIVCFKKINMILFSWLYSIIKLIGVVIVQYYIDVYRIVFYKETNEVFLWIHAIVQVINVFLMIIYMYRLNKIKPQKIHELNQIQIS